MVGEYRTVTEEQFDRVFDEAYLEVYGPRQDPEQAEQEALAAAGLAGLEPGAEILDCPCGFGRHSIPLARAGFRVTGVDRSQVLLDEAQRSAREGELELVQGDYRDLPLPDDRFDAVFNLFTSIGYTGREGDTQAFREFRRVLRRGGKLVVETMHRDRLARIFQARRWERLPTGYLIEEGSFDQVESVYSNTMTYIPDQGPKSELPYELRTYTATELVEMLREAGFEDAACYGGYEGEELTLDTRLVLLAAG
jgi:ubiquinone/menaquinone biosynthesis C-methylase UbiE